MIGKGRSTHQPRESLARPGLNLLIGSLRRDSGSALYLNRGAKLLPALVI